MNLLDKVEANSQSEMIKEKFRTRLKYSKQYMNDFNEESDYLEKINELEKEWEDCIREENWSKLLYICEELGDINSSLLYETSWGLKFMLDYLYRKKSESKDITKTNQIYNEATKYIDNDDIKWMRDCAIRLRNLLPSSSDSRIPFSWISKK